MNLSLDLVEEDRKSLEAAQERNLFVMIGFLFFFLFRRILLTELIATNDGSGFMLEVSILSLRGYCITRQHRRGGKCWWCLELSWGGDVIVTMPYAVGNENES